MTRKTSMCVERVKRSSRTSQPASTVRYIAVFVLALAFASASTFSTSIPTQAQTSGPAGKAVSEKWEMRFNNDGLKIRYTADVHFVGGAYEIRFQTGQPIDRRGNPTGAERPITGFSAIRSNDNTPSVFAPPDGVVTLAGPDTLDFKLNRDAEIRFEVPLKTTRVFVPSEVDTRRYLDTGEPNVSYALNESLHAKGHNQYISDPNLQLGEFENGERVGDAPGFIAVPNLAGEDFAKRLAVQSFITTLTNPGVSQRLQSTTRRGSPEIVGSYTFPAKFNKQEWKKVTTAGGLVIDQVEYSDVTRDVTRQIRQETTSGVAVVLHSPQENNGEIHWSWRAETRKDMASINTLAKGSPADGNHIVWGKKPFIQSVFVLNAQDAQKAPRSRNEEKLALANDLPPLFPWPGKEGERISSATDARTFVRELLVVGSNLNAWVGRQPFSTQGALSYNAFAEVDIHALLADLDGYDRNALNKSQLEAYELALRRDPSLDVLHVTAQIEGAIEPQPIALRVDDERVNWPLFFGDHNVKIDIVRIGVQAPDTFEETLRLGERVNRANASQPKRQTTEERANPVFLRDEIVFEATFESPDDIEGDVITIDFAGAPENAGFGLALEKSVELSRVVEEANRFRSKPFIVIEPDMVPANSLPVSADPNAQSSVKSAEKYVDVPRERALQWPKDALLRPRSTEWMTGRPFADAPVVAANEVRGNFIEALKRASSCLPKPPNIDLWKSLSLVEEAGIAKLRSKPLSTSSIWLGRDVTTRVGQHAALIMLRDAYLDIIGTPQAALKRYASLKPGDQEFDALAQSLWLGERSLVASLAGPRAKTIGEEVAETRRLQLTAERRAGNTNQKAFPPVSESAKKLIQARLKAAQSDIEESVRVARAAGDCDVASLVLLTSVGFEPVVSYLQARMTRLERDRRDNIMKRRPDLVGRRELNSLSALYGELDAVNELVRRRWAWTKASASIAAFYFGAYAAVYETTALATASTGAAALAETFDAVTTCFDNYCGYAEDQQKLGFARGASYVFGDQYLRDIEASTTSLYYRAFETFAQVAGAAMAVDDLYKSLTVDDLYRVFNSNTILSKSEKMLASYGNRARRAQTKNFRGIARDFWKKAQRDTTLLSKELEPKQLDALIEFLGTPSKHLGTAALRQTQSELQAAFESVSNPGWAKALISKLWPSGIADGVKKIPDYMDIYGIADTAFGVGDIIQGYINPPQSPDSAVPTAIPFPQVPQVPPAGADGFLPAIQIPGADFVDIPVTPAVEFPTIELAPSVPPAPLPIPANPAPLEPEITLPQINVQPPSERSTDVTPVQGQ